MNKEETVTENKVLIAVYGTLRQGFGNHRNHLSNADFLGTFKTEPEFSLYNLGGFPGLKQNGETSITMEVYAVNEREARGVDQLEGYTPGEDPWFYDKVTIDTPYGEAGTYIYVRPVSEEAFIESGDYTEFMKQRMQTTR